MINNMKKYEYHENNIIYFMINNIKKYEYHENNIIYFIITLIQICLKCRKYCEYAKKIKYK